MIKHRPRLIPALSILDRRLVKTTKFKAPKYLGDPINAVKLFSELEADELCLLDIGATRTGKIDFEYIEEVVSEAFVPISYGGAVASVSDAERLVKTGVEKVIVCSKALADVGLLRELSSTLGASSTVLAIDVCNPMFSRRWIPCAHAGTKQVKIDLLEYLAEAQESGVGEVLVTDIERDGTFSGINIDLLRELRSHISVPLLISGGASSLSDYAKVVEVGAEGMVASSMFVYHGAERAVLINYPTSSEVDAVLRSKVPLIKMDEVM